MDADFWRGQNGAGRSTDAPAWIGLALAVVEEHTGETGIQKGCGAGFGAR